MSDSIKEYHVMGGVTNAPAGHVVSYGDHLAAILAEREACAEIAAKRHRMSVLYSPEDMPIVDAISGDIATSIRNRKP